MGTSGYNGYPRERTEIASTTRRIAMIGTLRDDNGLDIDRLEEANL